MAPTPAAHPVRDISQSLDIGAADAVVSGGVEETPAVNDPQS
jgi:hypothetical protein